MLVAAGLRAGRSHRDRDLPCQDAFAVEEATAKGRAVAAVGDGLGSRRLSHEGSRVATRAAVESLLAARRLGPTAMHRAFVAARTAIRRRAKGLGASTDDLATTLHVVAVTADRVHAASVGDGAILSAGTEGPQILLPPPDAEYANEVVPVTAPSWRDHFRVGIEVAPRNVFLLTDGLTRLLMTRQAGVWKPFGPFFDRFLPRMAAKPFDPTLVRRFLDSDAVDHAWDDDKCLVVIGVGADAC